MNKLIGQVLLCRLLIVTIGCGFHLAKEDLLYTVSKSQDNSLVLKIKDFAKKRWNKPKSNRLILLCSFLLFI